MTTTVVLYILYRFVRTQVCGLWTDCDPDESVSEKRKRLFGFHGYFTLTGEKKKTTCLAMARRYKKG